jgi:hypothetical protein
LEPDSTAPWVVPLSDGGVQFEWHREGLDIEVIVSAEHVAEAWLRDETQGIEWEGAAEDLVREAAASIRSRAVSALGSE